MTWTELHDLYFLNILLNGIYRHPVFSSCVWSAVHVMLPLHRLSVKLFYGALAMPGLLLILQYGAFRQVPLLAWTILLCILLSALRMVPWTYPSLMNAPKSKSRTRRTLAIPARVGVWLIRDYFKADHRAIYWLDWIRIRHRQPVDRFSHERQQLLAPTFELPRWRQSFWQKIIFPLIDSLIAVHRYLPRFWKCDPTESRFPDPLTYSILLEEILTSEQAMHEAFAADSFEAYLDRAVNPEVLAASQRKAGQFGLKYCNLNEARIEANLLLIRPENRCQTIEQSAADYFSLWRFRKTYSQLWDWCLPRKSLELASEETSSANDIEHLPNSSISWFSAESALNFEEYDDEADSPKMSEDLSESQGVMVGFEEDDATDSQSTHNTEGATIEPFSETSDELENSKGFPHQEGTVESELARQAMNLDLIRICSLLEGELDVQATGDFLTDVAAVERQLHKPRLLPVAVRLLATYCLRCDQTGTGVDSEKNRLLTRLRERFRGVPAEDRPLNQARAMFYDLYFDILEERQAYGALRELFSQRTPQSPHQWYLLGNALALTALQLKENSSLKEDRLRDAAAAFFRAQTRAFWTQRYAGLILETRSALETMKLFTRFPVETTFQGKSIVVFPASVGVNRSKSLSQRDSSRPPLSHVAPLPNEETPRPNSPQSQSIPWAIELVEPKEKAKRLALDQFNNISGIPIRIVEESKRLWLMPIGNVRKVSLNGSALSEKAQSLKSGDEIRIQRYLFKVVKP